MSAGKEPLWYLYSLRCTRAGEEEMIMDPGDAWTHPYP